MPGTEQQTIIYFKEIFFECQNLVHSHFYFTDTKSISITTTTNTIDYKFIVGKILLARIFLFVSLYSIIFS